MVANNPTEESYRGDGSPMRSALRRKSSGREMLGRNMSGRKGSGKSMVSFDESKEESDDDKHSHYEIPDEDITTYTEEEKRAFDEFQRQQSAVIDYGCAYVEDDELHGENYDIPAFDGPAYSDDEILKFDLFQKAKSAQVQFDGVYDSDEEFEGENFNIPYEDCEQYTEQEVDELAHFQRTPSAFVQYDDVAYGESEQISSKINPVFHSPLHTPTNGAAGKKSADFAREQKDLTENDDKSAPVYATESGSKMTEAIDESPADEAVAASTEDVEVTVESEPLVDSEVNELDSSLSPQKQT